MNPVTMEFLWPLLAIVAYTFLLCMMRILSAQYRFHIETHRRTVEAHNMRVEYQILLEARRTGQIPEGLTPEQIERLKE